MVDDARVSYVNGDSLILTYINANVKLCNLLPKLASSLLIDNVIDCNQNRLMFLETLSRLTMTQP